MSFNVLALGGDGIGPEVLDSGIQVAHALAKKVNLDLNFNHDLLHGASWERYGTFCRSETIAAALESDAVLVGAVGGPEWDGIKVDGGPEMQDGLMRLRKEMDAFVGLRPAKSYPALYGNTPFLHEHINGAQILILREMCGGIMFSNPRGMSAGEEGRYAYDTASYSEKEIRRFARAGFYFAQRSKGKLVSADKANVMESYKLWRSVTEEVSAEFPEINYASMYADNCAYQMVKRPKDFDVIMGCNFLGDILSDLAAIISGGLGMLPSACLCDADGKPVKGIYEPVHGSAPDIAGQNIANPVGMILSVAMMFEYSFGMPDLAKEIERSVESVLGKNIRTPDLGGDSNTQAVTDSVIAEILNN